MLKNLQLSSLSFPFREIRFESFAIYQTVKNKGASARLTSAINYLLYPRSRAHSSNLLSSSSSISLSSNHIYSLACVLFLLSVKKEGKNGLKPTQTNWLCSFNELMNNCWRAAAAITARSSLCRASLQELCSVPQLSPQAVTTQTARVAPIQPPSLPPASFSVHLVPQFSSDPSLLFLKHQPSACQLMLLLSLSDFPESFVCICLALTLSQTKKKRVKVKSEAQD